MVLWIILGLASGSLAQPAALIVLQPPAASPTPEAALETLRAALAKQGVVLLDERAIAQRMQRPGLAPSPTASRTIALELTADALLEAAAYGRDRDVITRGTLELAALDAELSSINRADAAANAVLDLCLLVVRATLHRGDEASARREAARCAFRVPDLSGRADLHPPQVLELAELARAEQQAALRVSALGASAEACQLRAHGRVLGGVPSAHTLVPGKYQLQIDCGRPGLVHEVELRTGQTTYLEVSLELEQRAQLNNGVLTYAAARPADDLVGLGQLARWLGVDELWTWSLESQPTLTRLRRDGAQLAVSGTRSLGAAQPPEASVIASAVDTIVCRGCDTAHEPPPTLSALRMRVGLGLGAVAVASAITSWGLRAAHNRLENQRSELTIDDADYADTEAKLEHVDRSAVATSAVAAALLVAASVTGLPAQRPRAWTPAMITVMAGLGAASAALIAGGAVSLSHKDEKVPTMCPDGASDCYRERGAMPLGPMLLSQGLGLLSVPLTYIWRASQQRSQSVSVRASSTSIVTGFRASF